MQTAIPIGPMTPMACVTPVGSERAITRSGHRDYHRGGRGGKHLDNGPKNTHKLNYGGSETQRNQRHSSNDDTTSESYCTVMAT